MVKKKRAEFVKWFGPLLDALRHLGNSGKPREVSDRIARDLKLSEEVLDETLQSGGGKFHNQVAWARQYLVWEGYLDSSKYGTWKLTEKGIEAHLTEDAAHELFLKWVAINQEKRKKKDLENQKDLPDPDSSEDQPPEEITTEDAQSLIEVLRGPPYVNIVAS